MRLTLPGDDAVFADRRRDSAGKYGIFQKQSRRAGRLHGIPAGLSGADLRGEEVEISGTVCTRRCRSRKSSGICSSGRSADDLVLGMMKKEEKDHARQDMEDFPRKDEHGYRNISQNCETAQLYDGKRCDHAGGYRGSLRWVRTGFSEMIRAVTEKKQRKALDLYQDLLALRPPMRFSLLARQFNLLLRSRLLARALRSGGDRHGLRLQSFVVRNYIPMSRQYAAEECSETIDCVVGTTSEWRNLDRNSY